MRYLILTLVLILTPAVAFAKGDVNVGQKIPHNLELQDQNGKTRSFNDLKGKKGMVLVFVRSAQWCPFCQEQLLELNKKAKSFTDAEYPVVSVSYDTPQAMEKFITKNKPTITMLSDPRSQAIRAFGILNEDAAKGTRSYGIPHPGVYIVDANKKVQAKFFEVGYKKRPSTKTLMAKIEELNPKPKPKPVVEPMTIESMGEDPILPEDAVIESLDAPIEPVLPIDEPAKIETSIPAATDESLAPSMPDAEPAPMPETMFDNSVVPKAKVEETVKEMMPTTVEGAPPATQIEDKFSPLDQKAQELPMVPGL